MSLVSQAVLSQLQTYIELMPDQAEKIAQRVRNMPYRCLLKLMMVRMQRVLDNSPGAYRNSQEFRSDLSLIRESMEMNKGKHAGIFQLNRLQVREKTFGFHLATLDIRQDSLVHRQVVGQILEAPDWLEQSAETRADRLTTLLQADQLPDLPDDVDVRKTIEVFRSIIWGEQHFGRRALGPYIISMTQGADDVLCVLFLARMAGLVSADGSIPLDVAPLLETVDDLKQGEVILQRLFNDPAYKAHLASRKQRQIVMVGYSDSNKDGG